MSVSSSFHRAFQAYFIKRFKSISSWHIKECFKLILSDVSSLFLLDIWCHWSRLTIDSCLLHACSRACFIHVYYMYVVELVLFNDELNQEINYWLVFIADSLQVTSSMTRSIVICLCSRLTIEWWAQSRNHFMSFYVIVANSLLICVCNASQSLFWSRLLHSIELVLFMSLQQTHYRVTSSTTRSISNVSLKQTHYSCHSSRLFLFSFKYLMMNEFQLISSCFQTYSICSILLRHIVHVSFCLQYISSCCCRQYRE